MNLLYIRDLGSFERSSALGSNFVSTVIGGDEVVDSFFEDYLVWFHI